MGILDAFLVCIITYISELRGYALSKKQAVVDEQVKAMLRDQVEQTSDMNVMESLEVSDFKSGNGSQISKQASLFQAVTSLDRPQ